MSYTDPLLNFFLPGFLIFFLAYQPPDRFWNNPPVHNKNGSWQGENDLEQVPVVVQEICHQAHGEESEGVVILTQSSGHDSILWSNHLHGLWNNLIRVVSSVVSSL